MSPFGLTTNRPVNIEDSQSLYSYLRRTHRISPQERPDVRVLSGGVSNRTILLRRPDREDWVLKQALDKLRVDVDWFSSPERSHREATGMRTLGELAPSGTIPRLVFEDASQNLLAMEAVPEPHDNWKSLLLAGTIDDRHVDQFGTLLGTIHGNAFRRAETIQAKFADRSFFETLRLEPYYAYTAQQVPAAEKFFDRLISETRLHAHTLVHGEGR